MKLLVMGAAGQVGEKVSELAAREGCEVYGTYKSREPGKPLSGSFMLDKTDKARVEEIVSKVAPDVVVDTGALHNVDYCETHKEEAYKVNRDGTGNLSLASSKVGAKFVFVSTDFVFDGLKALYTEEDTPNPTSVYAQSKLAGEKVALESNSKTIVCRPAVIYSWVKTSQQVGASSSGKPLNFGAWLAYQLLAKKEVKIVTDQITSPTLADDLAGAILALSKSSASGVFHTAGATAMSRYDFSVRLAEKIGCDSSLIHSIKSSDLKQVAKRPLNSSLISTKLARVTGYSMMEINSALDTFASQSKEK